MGATRKQQLAGALMCSSLRVPVCTLKLRLEDGTPGGDLPIQGRHWFYGWGNAPRTGAAHATRLALEAQHNDRMGTRLAAELRSAADPEPEIENVRVSEFPLPAAERHTHMAHVVGSTQSLSICSG